MKKLKLVKLWNSHLNFKKWAKNLQTFCREILNVDHYVKIVHESYAEEQKL